MALLTHGSSPATARTGPAAGTGQAARNRRLRLTRHRSGVDVAPPRPEALHPVPDADGVTRIDLAAFEQVVRGTPARGFPALATPARGIALPAVEDGAWAGTLLPHEAEPFPADSLREPEPGEHWTLDDDALLRAFAAPVPVKAGRTDVPVPPPDELPEIEPLALAQIRQEAPLIPVVEPEPEPAAPAPAGAATVTAAASAPTGPARPKAAGRHPGVGRVVVGLGLAAGAAIAIGSAALVATVSAPAEDASPAPAPTITIQAP